MATFTCDTCGKDKDFEQFVKHELTGDKVYKKCKECRMKEYEYSKRGCDTCQEDSGNIYTMKCGCRTHVGCLDKGRVRKDNKLCFYDCRCGKVMKIVNEYKLGSWKLC